MKSSLSPYFFCFHLTTSLQPCSCKIESKNTIKIVGNSVCMLTYFLLSKIITSTCETFLISLLLKLYKLKLTIHLPPPQSDHENQISCALLELDFKKRRTSISTSETQRNFRSTKSRQKAHQQGLHTLSAHCFHIYIQLLCFKAPVKQIFRFQFCMFF